jgi:uncharacterized protein (DUF58 family)
MPAARAFLSAALLTALLLAAVAVPAVAWVALALDALLAAAVVLDARRAASVPLDAERSWPPLLAQGAWQAAEVRVRSTLARPLRVVLRETLHPALARQPLRASLVLPAAREVTWRYALDPRRRGAHRAGPLMARVLGPWGLAWSQRTLLPERPCRVYPQIRWEGRVGRLLDLAHRHELGQAPTVAHGGRSEPYALREYRSGDPPNKIHWKSSARHGRLISRDDTWERGSRLTVLLDCGRAMASMDLERGKLDHALGAALALARVASGRGDRVTLVAFSDRVERVVRLRPGGAGMALAYASVYDLQARLAEPAYDLAAEAAREKGDRRAIVVLLTSVVDLAAAELLRESLVAMARRHRPVLVNLEDPQLVRLALGRPQTPEEAFAKVASLEILLANRRLVRGLRRSGIRVASAPADRLAWETLSAYLATS